jgi:hypothetical protein
MANESALSGPARAPSSANNLTSEVVNSGKRRARNALSPSRVRFHVDPRDVPPEKAARRLPLTLEEFNALWPKLRERAFPNPDPTTEMYDLKAIDTWMDRRSEKFGPRDAHEDFDQRLPGIMDG